MKKENKNNYYNDEDQLLFEKLDDFKKFRITKKLIKKAKKDCIFLHCLPRGSEVHKDVFESINSKVWQQALNRVHVQKSILLYCFNKLR